MSQKADADVRYQAYGYECHGFTPYPFDYSHPHDRVTYPDAPITILEPQHPLMTHPNRITEEDFAGWIHDRGLYFFGSFDNRYTAILGCNDPAKISSAGVCSPAATAVELSSTSATLCSAKFLPPSLELSGRWLTS